MAVSPTASAGTSTVVALQPTGASIVRREAASGAWFWLVTRTGTWTVAPVATVVSGTTVEAHVAFSHAWSKLANEMAFMPCVSYRSPKRPSPSGESVE
ncbi:hypothetical protein D3C74_448060 [compost metagenome]